MTNFPYPWFNLKDRASGQLSTAVSSGTTTFSLNAGEGSRFPVSSFHIKCEEEPIYVSSRTNDTFTGAVSSSHTVGCIVYQSADQQLFERIYANCQQHTHTGGTSTIKTTSLIFATTTSSMPLGPLAFTVSSGVAAAFDFGIVFASDLSSNGLKVGLTFPTVSTFGATVRIPIAAAGTAGEFQGWISSSGGVVTGTAVQVAASRYFARVDGTILPTANGTLQLRFGAEVAARTISTFAGSYGRFTEL